MIFSRYFLNFKYHIIIENKRKIVNKRKFDKLFKLDRKI